MGLIFLDTNILLYSIGTARAEREKRERSLELLDREGVALSVQVLQEFYVQATRTTRADRLPHDIAAGLVTTWTRFRVQPNNLQILASALQIRGAHGFSYWDSAIIAAAQALGCVELYTEDMQHGRQIGGVTIIDPFR
jgi:predicted nucleic acid-binding protein